MTEKDDVHWITGQELREIYADDLSLDKYDEIRKRPASQNSGLYEPVGQEPDPCLVCPIWLKGSHQCDGNPCGSKVEYARKEHDRAIEQAAREDEQRKWRDDHPADLVWMTPEEEEARIRRDEREEVLDELGVLHGGDARKFNEELKNPSPLTPEAAEVMRKARELARK